MKHFVRIVFLFITTTSYSFADTVIELVSDPGDFIGQGQTYSYDDSSADITYSRNFDNGITVNIRNLPGNPFLLWTLNFAAPANAEIETGSYSDAERFPFQDTANPGLSFSGNGRGCNTLTGNFEVFQVAYDGSGDVTSLSASFEQHCEGATAALRGELNFNVVPPVGITAIGIAPYHVQCKNFTTGQRVNLRSSETFVDCRKIGLDIRTDDRVQIRVRGVATQ